MEIADVIKIREILKSVKDVNGDPAAISIVGDNMKLADERFDFLKWDDDNGILYILKQNPEKGIVGKAKINVMCTAYENIQYMSVNVDKSRFSEFAISQGFTSIQVNNALHKFYPNLESFVVNVSETRGKDQSQSVKQVSVKK